MQNGYSSEVALTTCTDVASNTRTPRGQGEEAKRIQRKLQNYAPEKSVAWNSLQTFFSSGVTHNELVSVATICCLYSNGQLALARAEKRDMRALVKWFDVNWMAITPVLQRVRLLDAGGNVIDLTRELRESNT